MLPGKTPRNMIPFGTERRNKYLGFLPRNWDISAKHVKWLLLKLIVHLAISESDHSDPFSEFLWSMSGPTKSLLILKARTSHNSQFGKSSNLLNAQWCNTPWFPSSFLGHYVSTYSGYYQVSQTNQGAEVIILRPVILYVEAAYMNSTAVYWLDLYANATLVLRVLRSFWTKMCGIRSWIQRMRTHTHTYTEA